CARYYDYDGTPWFAYW
nr:immunoglobulin heavy chain junction region [Mus musculus]